jgi:hypothetical protein
MLNQISPILHIYFVTLAQARVPLSLFSVGDERDPRLRGDDEFNSKIKFLNVDVIGIFAACNSGKIDVCVDPVLRRGDDHKKGRILMRPL